MTNGLLIKNTTLLDREQTADVLIREKTIERVGTVTNPDPSVAILEAGGRWMSPGLIDVHIQGAGGADVLDGSEESLHTISKTLARLGCTGFLATTVVLKDQANEHLRTAARLTGRDLGGARLLGIHLEGPFINPEKRGGVATHCIYPGSHPELTVVLDLTEGALRMMTIAPEMSGNLKIIEKLCEAGIVASFGHSDADYGQACDGIAAGITHVTHLCNAMRSIHHRQPGPMPAIFESGWVTAQIISDGVHIHESMIRMLYALLGGERCVCITDGVQGMGLPDGQYHYNGRDYLTQNGTARYLNGTLIGTTLGPAQMAMRFWKYSNCSMAAALNAASLNPARVLGSDERFGSIAPGKTADLVLLNADFSVWKTMVDGKWVYEG